MLTVRPTTEEHLLQQIAEVLQVDVERLTLTSTAAEFASWDSMALIEFVFLLQREYEISLPVDRAAKLVSVAEVIAVVREAGRLH